MSKIISADSILLGLVKLLAQTSRPDSGVGVPAPTGSLLMQPSGGQAHLFLKTASPNAKGWSRQNLANLKIFNVVKQFGAVPDGVTDNRIQINNAVAAARAVGGGVIYFPPGQYAFYKVGAGTPNETTIDLSNASNIVFLGDGYQSQLLMVGNAFASTWYLFKIHNFSHHIVFSNLYFDASRSSNPDNAGQQHTIEIQGVSTDPVNSGPHDIKAIGCFFDYQVGDHYHVFGNGSPARVVSDNVCIYNTFLATKIGASGTAKYRSAVGFQRGVQRTLVAFNFMQGSSDNMIDYEPTGVAINDGDTIIGNIANGQLHNAQVFTFGGIGASEPATNCTWAYNVVYNGGSINSLNGSLTTWIGNSIVNANNNTQAAEAVFQGQRTNDNLTFVANVFVSSATALDRAAFQLDADNLGSAHYCLVDGNCMRTERGNRVASLNSAIGIDFVGNVVSGRCDDAINGALVITATDLGVLDQTRMRHNTCVMDSDTNGRAPIIYSASVSNVQNGLVVGNLTRNDLGLDAGVQWKNQSPATFQRYHGTIDNLFIGGTQDALAFVDQVNTMAGCGNASSGAQIAIVNNSAGPTNLIGAHKGSLCVAPGGSGDSQILYYKESSGSDGLDETGWLRVGTTDIPWGCQDTTTTASALFLAPGSDLPNAIATEIQFRVPRACTIRNLRVKQTAGTGSGNVTYTLRRNGVSTSVSCIIAFLNTLGNSGGASSKFAAGDLVSIMITKTAVPTTSPKNAIVTIELA